MIISRVIHMYKALKEFFDIPAMEASPSCDTTTEFAIFL